MRNFDKNLMKGISNTKDDDRVAEDDIYNEGYRAFRAGLPEHSNPYSGIVAVYWSDGREDAAEDQKHTPR